MTGIAGTRFEAELSRVDGSYPVVDKGTVLRGEVTPAGGLLVVAGVDQLLLVGAAVGY